MKNLHILIALVIAALVSANLSLEKSTTVETLSLGVPLEGFSTEDAYSFYILNTIPNPFPADKHLVISATPFTGDCDIYVSTTVERPDVNNHDWKDDTMGGVIVEFNKTHPKFKEGGPFYIGIHGYTNTTFAVEAHVTGQHILLSDGIPQHSQAARGEYQYYVFNQTTPGRIMISVTAVTGDPDIFVSMNNMRPDWNNYQWSHTDWGTDYLVITPGIVGTYYIGIYGYDRSIYNLLLSHYLTVSYLMEGAPVVDYSESSQYRYFKILVLDKRGVDVVVNRLRWQGDPDLYISTRFERPNRTHYDWSAALSGDDHIFIPTTDAKFKVPSWYYISVYGWGSSVLYQLRWSYEDGHIALVSGKSATGIITVAGKYHYFKYQMPLVRGLQDALEINAYTTLGKIQIFGSMSEQYPSPNSKDRVGVETPTGISMSYETPISYRMYYFSILATEPCNYTIVAGPKTHFFVLRDGESHSYSSNLNEIRYFYFDILQPGLDVSIRIQTYWGTQDLYVSNVDTPNPQNYNWTMYSGSRGNELIIRPDHPQRKPEFDRFYMTVYGKASYNYFTITASVSNTTVEIRDGQVVTAEVELKKYRYYKVYVRNQGYLSINLKALLRRGSWIADPDLYISRTHEKPTDVSGTYDYRSINYGDDHLNIFAYNGYYYIGVHGADWPYEGSIPFELRASMEYDTLTQDGEGLFGYVAKGQYKYFSSPFWSRDLDARFAGLTLISGATELYAMDNTTRPTRERSKYSDRSWPGNAVNMKDSLTWGTYTFGVYGVVESEFWIHASSSDYQGTLTVGQPKLGWIKKGPTYFKVKGFSGHITKQDYQLNINLMNLNVFPPSVKVYISQTVLKPSSGQNTWATENDGYQNIHLVLGHDKIVANRDIYINVEGLDEENAKIRMNLVIPSEPLFITQDQPQQREIAANQTGSYVVLKARESENIQVVIESCDANVPPKFYASIVNDYPNVTHHEIASTAIGKYTQFIRNSSLGMEKRYYYVQTDPVPAKRTFSVYATTLNDIRPVPPVQNFRSMGIVTRDRWRITVPSVPEGPMEPLLYLGFAWDTTDQKGDINMETPCSMMDNADLIGAAYHQQWVSTFDMDLVVQSHHTYVVNVVAMNIYGISAAYKPQTIVVKNKDSLTLGVPVYTSVNETLYDQFVVDRIELAPGDQFVIAVTPLSGDVDLFVSMSAPATRQNNNYNATFPGAKLLYINAENQRGPGPYYIGVYGYTDAAFTIVAYLEKGDAIELIDGRPQISHAARGKYTYFKFNLDDNSNFTISVTPVSGDPDLYISTKTLKPDSRNYQWYSTNSGVDIYKIGSTTRDYLPRTNYYIGVYGWSDSIFSLVVTKEQSIELLTENLPHGQQVEANEHKFFEFRLTTEEDLTINVAPYYTWGNGDPDLCISTSKLRPRIPTDCTWFSQEQGEDEIVIPTTDPKWIKGTYYISVIGYGLTHGQNLRFLILGTTSYHDETLLMDGSTKWVDESAIGQNYKYFKFYYGFVDPANHPTFSALPVTGSVDIYVADQDNSKPTADRHRWAGVSTRGMVEVKLPANIPRGWYYAGVRTMNPTNYSMTASTNQVPIDLYPGMSLYSSVPHSYYKQFAIALPDDIPTQDLVIMVRAWNGDPDLYVSTTARATQENFKWKSESGGTIDYVLIKAAELTGERRLFIGVYGYAREISQFTITFYRSGESIPLQEAHPVLGAVARQQFQYYTFDLPLKGRVKFTLQVFSPSPNVALLYASSLRIPSLLDYQWRATSEGVARYSITIPNATPGTYFLGVYGSVGTNVTFSIIASTEFEYLEDGSDVKESVVQGQVRSFKMNVRNDAPSVLISVTLINGATELFVNSNSTIPTRSNYMWKSGSYPGNSILIERSDPRFRTGEWTWTVYGVENSNFLASAQTSLGLLKRGAPRSGIISRTQKAHYSFPVPWAPSAMFILVKAFDKSCVQITGDHETPGENPKWKSDSRNVMRQAILRIAKEETTDDTIYLSVSACVANTTLQIDEHRFEISYATEGDPFYIMHDYNTVYQLGKYRKNAWFEFLSDQYATGLNIFVDSCEGPLLGTMFLANSSKTFPIGKHNAELVSLSSNPYQTSIKAAPMNDQLKVSIEFANLDSIYSIYAVTKPDPRPVCESMLTAPVTLEKPTPEKKAYKITVPKATSQFFPLRMEILSVRVEGSRTPNANTPCALRTGGVTLASSTILNPEAFSQDIELDHDKAYMVNVLITDRLGRQTTCQPIQIGVNLYIMGVSVGGILIMIVILFIIAYLVIGMIFKKIKYKSTGLNLIPNVSFWRDVPFLIGDGILFLVTCGKKTRLSTKFDEITENIQQDAPIEASGEGYNEIK